MNEEPKQEKVTTDLIFNLDAKHGREIETIKSRMEEFLRAQVEVSHELKLVVQGQDSLRERFEVGTAGTLRELKGSFDSFRVEWGAKMSEDKNRDEKMKTLDSDVKKVEKGVEKVDSKFHLVVTGIFVTVFCAVLLAVMTFLAKYSARF